ncbi:MAG: hypothetical protein ABIN48_15125 [Ginsengibacter sp.]
MMIKSSFKILLLAPVFLFCFNAGFAQIDSTRRQTIEITSEYKPDLRNMVKVNLYATPISPDTSRPRLAYNIPAQNLFFSYQPVALYPLALDTDSAVSLGDRNQIKVGFGNLTTPYIAGALSFGDADKSLLNVYGNYISSRGKIENQDFSEIEAKAKGSLFLSDYELYGTLGVAQQEYYQYGYDHSIHTYSKEQLRRSYQDIHAGIGFRNIYLNSLGINYNPYVEAHTFGREGEARETTLILNMPVEKRFGDNVGVKISFLGNFNSYQIKNTNLKVSNKLFQLAPEFIYQGEKFNFHGGVTPSWNNDELSLLPNLYAEFPLHDNVFIVHGGWIGRFIENSFRTLSRENPYIQDPIFLKNTKEIQYYGGIKATLGKHFNFNAKVAYLNYEDMPLFVNDNFDGKSFIITNEPKLKNFQIHGDLNFISQDKFTLTAGLDLNTYTGLKDNAKAWGLYPLKLNSSVRWNAFDQLIVKGDLIAFSGAKAMNSDNSQKNMNGGTDLSFGGEFKINKQFSAWADFNNVFNSSYERWNNYPVYGFQVIGGVIFRF